MPQHVLQFVYHGECVFELGPFKVGDVARVHEVVWIFAFCDLTRLVLDAGVGEVFEGVAQVARALLADSATR